MMRRLALALLVVLASAGAALAQAACTHYASATGTGDGLTEGTPFKIQNYWAVTPIAGKVLCLLDGTNYQGPDNMIDPPPGIKGTSAAPITIRALNDGLVTIDGEFARSAVALVNDNDWYVLEGFNAKNAGPNNQEVISISGGSSDIIVRRVIAWDAKIHRNNNVVGIHGGGLTTRILFEDFAAFGTARKIFSDSFSGGLVTCRRCWIRMEGSIESTAKAISTMYNSYNSLWENAFITWDGISQPEQFTIHCLGDPAPAPGKCGDAMTNFDWPAAQGLISRDREDGNPCSNVRVLGSMAYVKATAQAVPDTDNTWVLLDVVRAQFADCYTIRHTLVIIDPAHPRFNNVLGFELWEDGTPDPTNVSAHNITSIIGAVGNDIRAPWDVQSHVTGTSLAAVKALGGDPWTGTAGANLCKRWVNGVVTNDPLWPLPMNQRIKDATASAGAYPMAHCPTCAGTAPRARVTTDVTAEIEALLGPIPAQCKTEVPPPPPPPPAPGAITFQGTGSWAQTTTSGTLTPTLPAGLLTNDVLVAISKSRANGQPSFSFPVGWTSAGACHIELGTFDLTLDVRVKAVAAGETAPAIGISDVTGGWYTTVVAYRGASPTTPQDATAQTGSSAAATTWIPPAITTVTNSAKALSIVATADNNDLALQTAQGFTAQLSGAPWDTSLGEDISLGLADKEQATAGAVTMPTWNQPVEGPDAWCGVTMPLRPATGGGPPPLPAVPATPGVVDLPPVVDLPRVP